MSSIVAIHDTDSDSESSSIFSSPNRPSSTDASTSKSENLFNDNEKINKMTKRTIVYANVNFDRNAFLPWRICRHHRESLTSNEIKTDALIEIDSDDEVNTVKTIQINSSETTADNITKDIVNLDSDEDDEVIKYHIIESKDRTIGVKKVPEYCLAAYDPPDLTKVLPARMRVIARRKTEMLPYITSQSLGEKDRTYLYKSDDNAFYAGIIGCSSYEYKGSSFYLVFFDDGHVQYVTQTDIRAVLSWPEFKYVHPNAKKFCAYYFDGPNAGRVPEIIAKIGDYVDVHVNGGFESACIVGTTIPIGSKTPQLFKIYFEKWNRYEWIYTGSPRLRKIWLHMAKTKCLWPFNPDAESSMIELSSGSEDEEELTRLSRPPPKFSANEIKESTQISIILNVETIVANYIPPKNYFKHICDNKCIDIGENCTIIFQYAPLDRPMLAGWKRQKSTNGSIQYTTPCGKSFKSISHIAKYLMTTNSKLTIDCFYIKTNIRCLYETITQATGNVGGIRMLNDVILGGDKERMRIPVISITGNYPHLARYSIDYHRNPRSKKIPQYFKEQDIQFRTCCDCTDNCKDKNKCSCQKLTSSGSNTGSRSQIIGYQYKRLPAKVQHGIYECNSGCVCNRHCVNRVITPHIEVKLEVFETIDRGYGVRTPTDLPKGTYVCCYFGDLLHGKTADLRGNRKGAMYGDEYFITLDHIEVVERKDGYESDVEFGEDDQRPSKIQKLIESPVSQTPRKQKANAVKTQFSFINYFPTFSKMKETVDVTQRTGLFGEDEEPFVVDGRFRGNVSRFFNHSCDPNCFLQPVFKENHDLRFPLLALFTAEDVSAGTELTWDYGYQVGGVEGREVICRCGASACRGRLL